MTITPILRVALPGKSYASNDPRDFSLDSRYSSIKIFKKNSGTVSVSASGNATVTINHAAGFFPLALLFVELTPGSGRWYPTPFTNISGEDTYVSGDFTYTGVNATSAVFKVFNKTGSTKVVAYRYYIIGDSGK